MTNRNKGDGEFAGIDIGGASITGGDTRIGANGAPEEVAGIAGDTNAVGDASPGGETADSDAP